MFWKLWSYFYLALKIRNAVDYYMYPSPLTHAPHGLPWSVSTQGRFAVHAIYYHRALSISFRCQVQVITKNTPQINFKNLSYLSVTKFSRNMWQCARQYLKTKLKFKEKLHKVTSTEVAFVFWQIKTIRSFTCSRHMSFILRFLISFNGFLLGIYTPLWRLHTYMKES